MAFAVFAVFGPRSFWYTTPSWFTINVFTPETAYVAGYATTANPPTIFPFTR